MKHRWDKGKKNANVLPNGEKIIHLKVGGRTSAVVPSVQKKTGPVAGDVSAKDIAEAQADAGAEEDDDEAVKSKPKSRGKKEKTANGTNGVKDEEDVEEDVKPATSKKRKSAATNGAKDEQKTPKKAKAVKEEPTPDSGRRRSSRKAK